MRALRQIQAAIRPSVRHFLEIGDDSEMRKDNPWLLVSMKYGREARAAFEAGDLVEVRRLLSISPAGHNFFVG